MLTGHPSTGYPQISMVKSTFAQLLCFELVQKIGTAKLPFCQIANFGEAGSQLEIRIARRGQVNCRNLPNSQLLEKPTQGRIWMTDMCSIQFMNTSSDCPVRCSLTTKHEQIFVIIYICYRLSYNNMHCWVTSYTNIQKFLTQLLNLIRFVIKVYKILFGSSYWMSLWTIMSGSLMLDCNNHH